MIYFPYIFRTIPISYDDSMSYYSQLLAINKILENIGEEIAKVEQTINGIEENVLEEVNKELESFKTVIESELTELQKTIDEDVKKQIAEINENFTKLYDDVEEKLAAQDKEIGDFVVVTNNKIATLRKEFSDVVASFDAIYAYIDKQDAYYWEELKKYCDEIYTSRKIYYVKNPITKKIDEVNRTLELMYYVSTNALTCDEYAELALTADQYKALRLTCIEYLRELRTLYLKHEFEKIVSMINPYTGIYGNVIETVKYLIKFHETGSLTADEYAALNLTADEYAAKNITAYDYYVNGKALLS